MRVFNEMKAFDLKAMQKKGMHDGVKALVAVVVLLILIAYLAPTALSGLFNTTAFVGVPTWVPSVLGILGVVAFIYIILDAVDK